MLTESRGEFSDFHSILRLRALRYREPQQTRTATQWKRRKTKRLMSKTMAMHEHFNLCTFPCCPLQKKQQ